MGWEVLVIKRETQAFSASCCVGDYSETGEGHNKKEAKRDAGKKMLYKLISK